MCPLPEGYDILKNNLIKYWSDEGRSLDLVRKFNELSESWSQDLIYYRKFEKCTFARDNSTLAIVSKCMM